MIGSGNLFESQQTGNPGGRRANLDIGFIQQFAEAVELKFVEDGRGDLSETFGPEDVFYYIYAILHSPSYRTRYAEFLKMDFPRVPLPSNIERLRELVPLGHQLAQLHLMEAHGPDMANYPVSGDNKVERHTYIPQQQQVWINSTQYFEPVPQEVWDFHIGGYQVCEKWLKDRKKAGRSLSEEDILHYCRIVAALQETIRLMAQIDEVIEEHGGWPIQ